MTETLWDGDEKLIGRSGRSKDFKNLDPYAGLAALRAVDLSPTMLPSNLLRLLRQYAIYTPSTGILRGLMPDPQQREPVGLSGGRLPEAILELLRRRKKDPLLANVCKQLLKMIDWAKSYGSRNVGEGIPLSPSVASTQRVVFFRDRYMTDKRNGLTGYDASEGALYVLFAAILVAHPMAPSILAIDNVDHGLNPRLARALMQGICRWLLSGPEEKQIFLTTHNPLVLDGLPLQKNDVRLFTVDRSRRGKTIIHRVEISKQLLAKANKGWTLSRLWVNGHLGGVPDV